MGRGARLRGIRDFLRLSLSKLCLDSRGEVVDHGPVCFKHLLIDRAEVPFADAIQHSITSSLAALVPGHQVVASALSR